MIRRKTELLLSHKEPLVEQTEDRRGRTVEPIPLLSIRLHVGRLDGANIRVRVRITGRGTPPKPITMTQSDDR
jgi:hypothetical protein